VKLVHLVGFIAKDGSVGTGFIWLRALVMTVMNLQVSQKEVGEYLD
jgi:hypothetical protein